MSSESKWIIGTVSGTVLCFSILITIFWQIGFFDFTGTEANAKIVAAALVLVGSLIATLVSLFGIFIRQSIEKRSSDLKQQAEKRLRLESERNSKLSEEAEKRLNIEAAIQSIGLLSTSSGAEVPATQRAAVLFTLANLGLLDLAMTMLRQMLDNDRIDINSAVWLVNLALKSKNETCQMEASEILLESPKKFLDKDGSAKFPETLFLAWNTKFPILIRQNLCQALLQLIVVRPFSEWSEGSFNGWVCTVHEIWLTEPNIHIKLFAEFCLNKMISFYQENTIILSPSGSLDIDELRTKLLEDPIKIESLGSTDIQTAKEFEKWVAEKDEQDEKSEQDDLE